MVLLSEKAASSASATTGWIPEMARLHGAVAGAIADGDVDGAGRALDRLLDNIEAFTRATITEL